MTGTPRLAPRPLREWSDADLAVMRGRLARAEKYLTRDPSAPPLPNLLGLFGHHPELTAAFMGFSGLMLDAPVLAPRDRELVVLRVAYRTRSQYEWAQHVTIGQEAGLSAAHVGAVGRGPDDEIWTADERLLLRATDELLDDWRLGDATWQALAARYDPRELLELLFAVGSYLCLALVLNSVDLAPDTAAAYPIPEGD
jgi:alkylhydroperoxidase family enzyme